VVSEQRLGSCSSGQGPVAVSGEHDNKPWGSVKVGCNFLYPLKGLCSMKLALRSGIKTFGHMGIFGSCVHFLH
jgi:hypothetical protein